jgi:hypothetical protein
MIENTDELVQAIEQMGRMQKILESFQRHILPKNSRNFALFAEGPVDEIGKLQADINTYISQLENPLGAPALRETPPDFGAKI